MARRGDRKKLDTNIYQDATGCSVIVQVRGVQRELRFLPETALETLQRQRDELRADLHTETPATERGTLAADAVRYLAQIAGRPGFKADRSHLRAWLDRLGPKRRASITAGDVRAALAAWRTAGTWTGGRGTWVRTATTQPASEKTLKERWRVLRHLYKTLDGAEAKTPCDEVPRPKPPAPVPVGVDVARVQRVANALRQRATATPLRSRERRDYAWFAMLTTTAQRPAQIERARPEDFHLREGYWIVSGAKGGPTHAITLNREMRAAVRLFIQAHAFGKYDEALIDVARAHGWPKTIPLYNARHSAIMDAIDAGADLYDVQAMAGHTSPATTQRIYGGVLQRRLKAAAKRLEGRLKIG